MFIAPLHKGTDRGRCGVELCHLVAIDNLPEACSGWIVWAALEHQSRHTVGEDAVDDVGVPGDPAAIGGAPEGLVGIGDEVESVLGGGRGENHVPGGGVDDALWFAGRAGGVEQEEHVLGFEFFAWAIGRRFFHLFFPAQIEFAPRNIVVASTQAQHMLDGLVALFLELLFKHHDRVIDILFQWYDLAATP